MMQGQREPTPPTPTPGSQPFWDATAKGKILFGLCKTCEKPHYYPRNHCPFCHADTVTWEAATGHGTIYAMSVLRRTKTPYAIAYVRLDEGPCMLTNLVSSNLNTLHIGQKVRAAFRSAGAFQVPFFTPIDEER